MSSSCKPNSTFPKFPIPMVSKRVAFPNPITGVTHTLTVQWQLKFREKLLPDKEITLL